MIIFIQNLALRLFLYEIWYLDNFHMRFSTKIIFI